MYVHIKLQARIKNISDKALQSVDVKVLKIVEDIESQIFFPIQIFAKRLNSQFNFKY